MYIIPIEVSCVNKKRRRFLKPLPQPVDKSPIFSKKLGMGPQIMVKWEEKKRGDITVKIMAAQAWTL
jgi:hypothetical protein